ncbi:MAG: DUF1552 domain-containing protein [Gammaproteobacteria bacterium]|nr:DUF1552 domain-containing protein [Gammaproteobacteria bacterium]
MFLTRKFINRRSVLRGMGASIALPLLDAMVPAGAASTSDAASQRTRLGFIYFPHGAVMDQWTPATTGRGFEFTPILKPLEPMRDQITVVSGLRNKGGESSSPHGIIEMTWLSCVGPDDRDDADRGVTADQLAARQLGAQTPLPSLELCGEAGGSVSYRTPRQPLPMEGNPRKVFYMMFGQGDSYSERQGILAKTGSLLDYVREATGDLNRRLSGADRSRVSDFLDSIREVEQRIDGLSARAASLAELPDAPLGAPDDFTELLDIQFEMIALAWQTDQTRVASLRMVKESSMRTYTNLGISEAFHPLSHHQNQADKLARLVQVQRYHTARFAKFVRRLADMEDVNGSVLDNSIVLFGSNMSNSDRHNNDPLPSLLAGRGSGALKGGQHLAYPQDTPHANLLVTMLQKAGVMVESIADSNGVFGEA